MILDKIENAKFYFNLNERITSALKYLQTTDIMDKETGRHDIDGANIFALISDYMTKAEEDSKPEAHKKYIDVQYVASGAELLGYRSLSVEEPSKPYDEEKDFMLFDEKPSFVKFEKEMFAVLFPHDMHMPGIMIESPALVRKVVIKVKIY